MAAERRYHGLDNAKYCLSEADIDLERLANETIKITNVYAEILSADVGLTRQSRALSVAFGSSLRDRSFASGIR